MKVIDHTDNKAQRRIQTYTHPHPHVVIDNFLDVDLANQVEQEFPQPEEISFYQNTPGRFLSWHMNPLDPVLNSRTAIKAVFNCLESAQFRTQLAEIFNIKTPLLCDPNYTGSGLLVAKNGCIHKIHRDRNYDPSTHFYRRLVVLIYFNKNWQPEYGGTLNFWNKSLKRHKAVEPWLNRCVVFENTRHAYHDVSDIHMPEGMTRKVINFYYYTEEPPASEADMYVHNTEFFPAPNERVQYWTDAIFKGFPIYLMRALAPKCVPLTRVLQQSGIARLWLAGKTGIARIVSPRKYRELIKSEDWQYLKKPDEALLQTWRIYNG